MMVDKGVLIDVLNLDFVGNASFIYFLEHYELVDYFICDGNVLFRGISDKEWVFIIAEDEDGFMKLLPEICDGDKNFGSIEAYMKPYLIENSTLDWQLECELFVLGDVIVEDDELKSEMNVLSGLYSDVKFKPLDLGEAEFIFKNYSYAEYTNLEYIRDRISRDISVGCYINHQLVAWVLTHDEGSIGALEVLNRYKRQGIANIMMKLMIKEKKASGQVAFLHIEPSNIASMNMADKLGFVNKGQILWIGRS